MNASTSTTSPTHSVIKGIARKAYLPLGRLIYAGASGVGIVAATQLTPSLSVVGEYIYQIGFASALATLSGFGLDRIMARRMSSGELATGLPRGIVRFRLLVVVIIMMTAALAGFAFDSLLAFVCGGLFVISRMIYADLEALWIGASLGDRSLFAALIANGVITGGGIIAGSLSSSAAMMIASSMGNLVAMSILLLRRRLRVISTSVPGVLKEAQGISWSLLLAIIYARVDLLMLAALAVPLDSVALYGILTRVFDALALIRGSLAQNASREVSSKRIRTKARRLLALAMRTQAVIVPFSFLGVLIVWLGHDAGVEVLSGVEYIPLALALASLPLFFSHLPTTAMIYSDARTHRLLIGSVITCLGSVGLKWLLISHAGLNGAILAIGAVEILSCLVFFLLYWANARSWRSSRIVWVPLCASVASVVIILVA
jgi:O-antigen/teichoic acid export membrane protein